MIRPVAALLLLVALPAGAEQRPTGASRELFVEGSGGGYEVPVSPNFITVFYLPEKVTRAFGSNQKDFRIDMLRDTVVVRPLTEQPGLTANLGIVTGKLKINVVLKLAANPEDAVSQVIFTRADARVAIERQVAAAVAPLVQELAAKQRRLDELVRERAREEIAEAMLRDYLLATIGAITRNEDGVVLRVPRAVRMGEDRYLYFTIQNRGGSAYVLQSAALRQDGRELGGVRAVFSPRGDGVLGRVEAGQRGAGILVLPAGQLRPGRAAEIVLREARKGRLLSLGDLRVP